MWGDFKAFLLKQNALALAIAFVLGAALNTVVQAIVNDFIMPFVGIISPGGEWRTAKWMVGSAAFGVGDFLSAVLNFIIVGLVAWRLSKLIPAGPGTKSCPFCFATVDSRATRCQQCTSTI